MKSSDFKFFVSDYSSYGELPVKILYAGNTITNDVFWWDSSENCWNKSIFPLWEIKADPDFVPVERFDDGSISISDALGDIPPRGLKSVCPGQFGDLQISIDSEINGEM